MALAFRGCLSREKILELADGRQWINHRTLTKLGLKPSEIIWFIEKLEIGGKIRYLLYAGIAERVLHIYEKEYPDDKHPRHTIKDIRDYVAGKISKEKMIAGAANAYDSAYAAYDSAYSAANAAYSATYTAATAAYAAASANAAATAATYASAAADNKKEEQAAQLKLIDKYLKSVA